MKAIIVCYICKKPKKFSDSYALKVHEFVAGGEVTKTKVRACRTCTKRIGYKVKAGMPAKTKKV